MLKIKFGAFLTYKNKWVKYVPRKVKTTKKKGEYTSESVDFYQRKWTKERCIYKIHESYENFTNTKKINE